MGAGRAGADHARAELGKIELLGLSDRDYLGSFGVLLLLLGGKLASQDCGGLGDGCFLDLVVLGPDLIP